MFGCERGCMTREFIGLLILIGCCVLGDAQVSCPTGDTSGTVSNGQTCAELVTSLTIAQCYDPAIEAACCSSCNAVNTGVSGCEFNDRATCFEFLCSTLVNQDDCCATCGTITSSTATTITTTVPTSSTETTVTTSTSTEATSTTVTMTTITSTEPTTSTDATTVTPGTTTTTTPVATTQLSIATTVATTPTTTQATATSTSAAATTQVTTSSLSTATSTVSTTQTTANNTAGSLQGESSRSRDNKDAAIIGGTVGGFFGVLFVAGLVGLGIHFLTKSKLNKVSDFSKSKIPPKTDSPHKPEVVVTMAPGAPIEPNKPGIVNGNALDNGTTPRAVIDDKTTPGQLNKNIQLPSALTDGPTVIKKPFSLPPLDASGLSSNLPNVDAIQTINAAPNGVNGTVGQTLQTLQNENDVKFLHLDEATVLSPK